jgi:hypothetical protein
MDADTLRAETLSGFRVPFRLRLHGPGNALTPLARLSEARSGLSTE